MVRILYIRRQRFYDPKYIDKKPFWHIAAPGMSHTAMCGYKIPILEEPRRARNIKNNLCYQCTRAYEKLKLHEIEVVHATGDLYEI